MKNKDELNQKRVAFSTDIISYPEERKKIVNTIINKITKNFDVIAATETTIPFAAWVASKLKKPMIFIRDQAKSHGKESKIEGLLKEKDKVLLIGDKTEAVIKSIEEKGGVIKQCINLRNL